MIGLQRTDQATGVFLRKVALRNEVDQERIQSDCSEEDREHEPTVVKRPAERALVTVQHPIEEACGGAALARLAAVRRNSAHIIGVVVSEIPSEIIIASDSVRVNSRNSRPRMPPSSRMGVNTATSDRLIDRTVNPTSRAPSKAACMRDIPASI